MAVAYSEPDLSPFLAKANVMWLNQKSSEGLRANIANYGSPDRLPGSITWGMSVLHCDITDLLKTNNNKHTWIVD